MAEQIDKAIGLKAGEKTRSYREFGFSVIIPVISQIHDTIQVKFSVKKQTGNNMAMIVDQCRIADNGADGISVGDLSMAADGRGS